LIADTNGVLPLEQKQRFLIQPKKAKVSATRIAYSAKNKKNKLKDVPWSSQDTS
jgi:hypothetical protein